MVCSLTLFFLAASATLRAVGLPQDGHHLLFGESTLPHGLLAVEEPSSRNYWSEETGQVNRARSVVALTPVSNRCPMS